jgi:hypothetical protein
VPKIVADPDYSFKVAVIAAEVALDETCKDFYREVLSSLRPLPFQTGLIDFFSSQIMSKQAFAVKQSGAT